MKIPREWFYMCPDGKQHGPLPERHVQRLVQGYPVNPATDFSGIPNKVAHYSFRCFGSSRWIDLATFLALTDSAKRGECFPPDFFDNPKEKREPLFYPITQTKFLVLSLTTFGMYYLFWVYKTWRYVGKIDVRHDGRSTALMYTLSDIISFDGIATLIAEDYLPEYTDKRLLMLSDVLQDVFARGIFFAMGFLALVPYLRVFIVAPFFFPVVYLPAIKAINDVNAKRIPGYVPDGHFSLMQWVWVAVSTTFIVGSIAFLYSLSF